MFFDIVERKLTANQHGSSKYLNRLMIKILLPAFNKCKNINYKAIIE
ncbi:hypothetical protein HMPREF1982_01036 [Clostridiales bacterium oral taxon 876 str. F0540]|nr:hypothetical protein HMPREF1982_01036 [Clostridiales bacterium oral taxon 876 str. F0540]